MAFCTKCGAQIQEGMAFCGSCGAPAGATASGGAPPAGAPAGSGATPPVPASTSGGMASNVAGALAYLFIPAIVFLVVEPYNKDKFVRFHSFQSIFFFAAWFVLGIGLSFVSWIIGHIPFIGWMFDMLLWLVIGLGMFVLWIFLVLKAYQNQKWMLPVIGGVAVQQAG